MASAEVSKEFDGLLDLLKRARGFDFTGYKRASLVRRIRKRMQSVGAETYTDYMAVLEREPGEFDHLFNTVLINVTTFFRDGVPWDYIGEEIVPNILGKRGRGETIRVWSAGCATGQEAYTLAMILAERLGVDEFLRRVKIYATDLDEDALTYARHGSYTTKETEAVPDVLRERYFERQNGRFYFSKALRRSVIFGRNDLVDDAPISKIDLLVCRNTLMYFDSHTQARVLNRFHFALRDGGYLFLGKAETLSTHTNAFAPVDVQRRVFAKVASKTPQIRYEPSRNGGNGGNGVAFERELVSTAAFEKAPLAQFVVDAAGNLALANERARQLFRLNPTDLGRPLKDLELSYRPLELRSLIDQIRHEGRPIRVGEVAWLISGQERWYEVHLLPLYNTTREMMGVTVTFNDISDARDLKVELQRSHTELETAYEELQSSNEELETTNEELQSTVEELETTNEELQSTNEELETMNEELQSTNEELGSINDELRNRGSQLDDLNRFLRSVFASLGGGVAVVDHQMRVKVWNHRAEDLWGVRSEEAVDQRFTDLDIGLPVDKVKPLIADTFKRNNGSTQLTLPAVNRRGKKIQVRITGTPLIEPDQKQAQGVILLMEEVAE
ncbi:MAG TPA: CheR family methyltransferase [Gemmatimonadaceae bacterium]|nr:CheR family methyltransferase [Gemmatimonadaceae bacterium]